LRFDVKLIIVM